MNTKTNLAIFTTSKGGGTDTFIQAHIKRLNANVNAFYGMPMPVHSFEAVKSNHTSSKWKKLLPVLLHERVVKKLSAEDIIEQNLISNNIEVVLAEYGHIGCKVLPVCKKLSIPLIVHFHGHDAYRYSMLEEFGEKYKALFEYASFIISVSNNMTLQLIELGAPAEKVIYNPYGPNESFFAIKPNYNTQSFLSVGRFVEKKAPYLTLLAFHEVQKKYNDAKLIFVGDGLLLPICKNIVKSLQIKNVYFKGLLSHEETVKTFSEVSCYVQHSTTASDGDSEGTPVAILEAGAAGLPVVATKHAGIPDVVVEGETGYLVDEKDVSAMTERMCAIISNENLRQMMGEKARERIKENFGIQKHLNAIDELITESLFKFKSAIDQ